MTFLPVQQMLIDMISKTISGTQLLQQRTVRPTSLLNYCGAVTLQAKFFQWALSGIQCLSLLYKMHRCCAALTRTMAYEVPPWEQRPRCWCDYEAKVSIQDGIRFFHCPDIDLDFPVRDFFYTSIQLS